MQELVSGVMISANGCGKQNVTNDVDHICIMFPKGRGGEKGRRGEPGRNIIQGRTGAKGAKGAKGPATYDLC